jgi:hypothetical protein
MTGHEKADKIRQVQELSTGICEKMHTVQSFQIVFERHKIQKL